MFSLLFSAETINCMQNPRFNLKNLSPRLFLVFVVSFLLFAQTVSAQVFISEIKCTGNNEWVEVLNDGASVDITLWKFFENGSNHKLKPIQGGVSLPANGYAVIANDATAFLTEHAGFSGILFDSSFSLLDVGETISIKSSDTTTVDTVSYSGIKGSKNSTQKIGSAWYESSPTPGKVNALSQDTNTGTQNTSTGEGVSTQAQTTSSQTPTSVKAGINAEAGPRTRVVIAGAPITFEGKTSGLESVYGGVHTSWSFGDGALAEGATVSHTYYYPGEYTAVLDVVSGSVTATDRMLVRVILPDISLATGGDSVRSFVMIENNGGDEIDLSGWQVVSGEKSFTFPKNTILGVRKSVTLASEVTGLATPQSATVELHFSNGTTVATKNKNKIEAVLVAPAIPKVVEKQKVKEVRQTQGFVSVPKSVNQEATVSTAFATTAQPLPQRQREEEGSLWPWYIGAAFLSVLALLALRFTRVPEEKGAPTADDFEIIDDDEPY